MKGKKLILFFLIVTIVFTACNSRYKFWDISKFHMAKNALQDKEEIKLFYTSQGPDNNEKMEYYIHVIAISLKTGDTVNILTTANNGFTMEDKERAFNYFNEDNIVTKSLQMDTEKMKEGQPVEMDKPEMKKITKVARDTKFDKIADNNFPTVIGSIGFASK